MELAHWITLILLGGYLGSLGQSLRIALELIEAKARHLNSHGTLGKVRDGRVLLRGLATGFAVGALAMLLALGESGGADAPSWDTAALSLPVLIGAFATDVATAVKRLRLSRRFGIGAA